MASTTPKRLSRSFPISRSETARSATASPRVSSSLSTRRTPTPAKLAATAVVNGSTNESLKEDIERIEQLRLQLQDRDQTITSLSTENDNLTSALHTAETRLNELYAEQSRSEMELSQRIELAEKFRSQVHELEKEKRDVLRRYNAQMTTFDAERQAFYDNEQHLKSRIQSLTQTRRKQPEPSIISEAESETEVEEEEKNPTIVESIKQDINDPEQEPAEITSLKLELSTLSTSYTSLQSTLVLLQSQLVDLKRVNHELQEENESYMILLREKTLSGQYDVMKQMRTSSTYDEDGDDDDVSLESTGRSTLDRVEEEVEDNLGQELRDVQDSDSVSSRHGRSRKGQGRKRGQSTSHSPSSCKGESLAGLPITGPGLDLAAELGRAENKDIVEGNAVDDRDRSVLSKSKRSKKDSGTTGEGLESSPSMNDLESLRSEVKALKDANKALSLYASKIIDRIIAQEGFEHVLAVDYDKEPPTPSTATPKSPMQPTLSKPRRHSVMAPSPVTPTVSDSSQVNSPSVPKLGTPVAPTPSSKAQRRSLSFDWKSFSIFNIEKKPDPNLRPLTLKPGASPVTGARKLETQEDDEDRKERERLNATMKLMGIQPNPATPPIIQKSFSSPGPAPAPSVNRRFSLFGPRVTSPPASDSSSLHSTHSSNSGIPAGLGIKGVGLTQEALEQAEAQNTLAALDAHEKSLSAEIAKGSGSGFTEITRRSRKGRQSGGGSGSGSTVWSAGMSGTGEDD
ncbi:hypothetical protein E1B28_001178 [Marasmius oreades]|uniref:Uncharacterized protein n=1 Tax=Marasmius oreades TaxID=181124 RepID=A0A9P7V2Y2_9AGAR|nr:uncharacterized protein E1B28_001178 [Marasmius oreades]KAG7099320.1 hypothetical protein E1B28_001178 [Marasmius oreades]